MSTNPILHLLGLAKRAGKLEIGEEPVGAVARSKHAKLILLASDVPSNTYRRAATFGQVGNVLQVTLPYTKDEIGSVLGRSSVAMVALTDAGFAGAIGDKLIEIDAVKYGAAASQLRNKADRTYARQKEKRQHEKNMQRGKGKPWAVPPTVAEEKQQKKEKKKADTFEAKSKSPNLKPKSSKKDFTDNKDSLEQSGQEGTRANKSRAYAGNKNASVKKKYQKKSRKRSGRSNPYENRNKDVRSETTTTGSAVSTQVTLKNRAMGKPTAGKKLLVKSKPKGRTSTQL